MKITYIFLAFLLLGSSAVFAQSKETLNLEKSVEDLRQLLIKPDADLLEKLTSKHLTYGHSNGTIENQQEFIDFLLSGKSQFKDIKLKDQTMNIVGNIGLVRHVLLAETNNEGNIANIKLGVLLVWEKNGKNWKLLARQAYKL